MSLYHPSVFKTTKVEKEVDDISTDTKLQIPENTLYEEPLVIHKKPNKKYVTVFGFSNTNMQSVLNKLREVAKIDHIEYGKNWINLLLATEDSVYNVLKLNNTYVNGEIIGVFKENYGVIDDKDIFLKKKGVFGKLMEYLFGE